MFKCLDEVGIDISNHVGAFMSKADLGVRMHGTYLRTYTPYCLQVFTHTNRHKFAHTHTHTHTHRLTHTLRLTHMKIFSS